MKSYDLFLSLCLRVGYAMYLLLVHNFCASNVWMDCSNILASISDAEKYIMVQTRKRFDGEIDTINVCGTLVQRKAGCVRIWPFVFLSLCRYISALGSEIFPTGNPGLFRRGKPFRIADRKSSRLGRIATAVSKNAKILSPGLPLSKIFRQCDKCFFQSLHQILSCSTPLYTGKSVMMFGGIQ